MIRIIAGLLGRRGAARASVLSSAPELCGTCSAGRCTWRSPCGSSGCSCLCMDG